MILPSGALSTRIGSIVVEADGDRLSRIMIMSERATEAAGPASPLIREALAQLEAWFGGTLARFDLPLIAARTPRGAVLRAAIAAIPPGQTVSYGTLARTAGFSPRAIGQACARNPFPIVIPCHRVTGSAGLGHYSAGNGIAAKRWLLAHDERIAAHV